MRACARMKLKAECLLVNYCIEKSLWCNPKLISCQQTLGMLLGFRLLHGFRELKYLEFWGSATQKGDWAPNPPLTRALTASRFSTPDAFLNLNRLMRIKSTRIKSSLSFIDKNWRRWWFWFDLRRSLLESFAVSCFQHSRQSAISRLRLGRASSAVTARACSRRYRIDRSGIADIVWFCWTIVENWA